jgi:prolyl-tRNA editing enzyme YbaK/EbsC (Cys-tRNA(Pro) deacylase)
LPVSKKFSSINLLESKGIKYRLICLTKKAITVEDVIEFSKEELNPDEICKTILLNSKKMGKVALLLKGYKKIDFKKLKPFFGKMDICSGDEVFQISGFKPGAVCPLSLKIPLYIDKQIFSLDKINFGSGHHKYGIEIQTKDLEKLIDFKVIDALK